MIKLRLTDLDHPYPWASVEFFAGGATPEASLLFKSTCISS